MIRALSSAKIQSQESVRVLVDPVVILAAEDAQSQRREDRHPHAVLGVKGSILDLRSCSVHETARGRQLCAIDAFAGARTCTGTAQRRDP